MRYLIALECALYTTLARRVRSFAAAFPVRQIVRIQSREGENFVDAEAAIPTLVVRPHLTSVEVLRNALIVPVPIPAYAASGHTVRSRGRSARPMQNLSPRTTKRSTPATVMGGD